MIREVVARVRQEDPVRGKWCVNGDELGVWVDASSIATGVSLEHDGAAVKDASWLRKERDTQHINLAELDAVLKGVNKALMWKATILHLHTDSVCTNGSQTPPRGRLGCAPKRQVYIYQLLRTSRM